MLIITDCYTDGLEVIRSHGVNNTNDFPVLSMYKIFCMRAIKRSLLLFTDKSYQHGL